METLHMIQIYLNDEFVSVVRIKQKKITHSFTERILNPGLCYEPNELGWPQ